MSSQARWLILFANSARSSVSEWSSNDHYSEPNFRLEFGKPLRKTAGLVRRNNDISVGLIGTRKIEVYSLISSSLYDSDERH